ncbi:hypothetical protein [Methanoregula sp.]|uniref:hypothetical protein n=1 Tax=Methanoregula sp. TaxID=2052170 RepID=UPI003C3E33C2
MVTCVVGAEVIGTDAVVAGMVDVLDGAAGEFPFETHPATAIAIMRRKIQMQRTDDFMGFLPTAAQ